MRAAAPQRSACQPGADFARLAFEWLGFDFGAAGRGHGPDAGPVATGDPVDRTVEDRIARLGRLFQFAASARLQPLAYRRRARFGYSATHQHGESILERRRIGRRRAAADHRRVVVDHVRQGQRQYLRRTQLPQQPSTLGRRQVLAHRVQLVDRGAVPEKLAGRLQLVFQQDAGRRRRQQRGGAARDQDQGQVAGTQFSGPSFNVPRRGLTALVRQRVSGSQSIEVAKPFRLVVSDDQHVGRSYAIAKHLDRGSGHPERRLPDRQHRDTAACFGSEVESAKRRSGRRRRVGSRDARQEDPLGPLSERLRHASRIRLTDG